MDTAGEYSANTSGESKSEKVSTIIGDLQQRQISSMLNLFGR